MRRFLLIMCCFFALPVLGSHIVGGEFEIRHISGNSYRINLILYFDKLNGSPAAKDFNITAAIFRKRDNAFIRNVFLGSPTSTDVEYTQPACSNGEVETEKLLYTTTETLADNIYNDPQGYYISWERCCRNYTITNIFSNNPDIGGISAGQTFYLEFPPVVKDGQPFINSTPRLFPPLNDYACPRKPYYVDFAGVDEDDDSLVYTLVAPLSTHTSESIPSIIPPAPYPDIVWKNPFSLNNILAGVPDLKISSDGFLTATPTQQGLFVFAVKCEEFRNKKKIGEVRRDFQMLVVDVCPRADPPNIMGKKLTDVGFTHDENMTVTFSNSVDDLNRCIEVQVSDPDASNQDDNFTENVKIRAIPLSFKKDISGILPGITNGTLVNGSTLNFQICFDECPYVEGPFQIGIVAYDDACSLPLSDTLKITVNIEPPHNTPVRFITSNVDTTLQEGYSKTWIIQGIDDDLNQIVSAVFTNGYNLSDVGMTFTQKPTPPGTYEAELRWDTRCDVYDFSRKTEFELKVLIEDVDLCMFSHPDTMVFKLRLKLPDNMDPIIDSDLTTATKERRIEGITRKVNETLRFNVFGADGDNDFLILGAQGKDFKISDYNITFPGDQKNGNVSSPFNWNIACDKVDLKVKDEFEFEFIVIDNANKCRLYKADTLNVVVNLEPPDNSKPDLRITSTSPTVLMDDNALSIFLGEQISLSLIGTDADLNPEKDLVRVELIEATGTVIPTGYSFAPAEGLGTALTTFVWNPDCTIFENNVYKNDYDFTFRVYDDKCFNSKGDTVKIAITVKDLEKGDTDFMPPNFITPNGDNLNDFFAMVKEDETTHELVSILPRDNCTGHFAGISIFNRWGKEVYASDNRDFRWYADGESGGVYYYLLTYTDKEYKGLITVRE